jgi:hypothetical protein
MSVYGHICKAADNSRGRGPSVSSSCPVQAEILELSVRAEFPQQSELTSHELVNTSEAPPELATRLAEEDPAGSEPACQIERA